jgi:hypothetical protein
MEKYTYLALIGAVLVLLVSGCAWLKSHGKVRALPREEQEVTLQQLVVNWQDYSIYYAGLSIGTAAGVMFDPKSDRRSLVGDTWTKVEDRETLSRLINVVRFYLQFYPRLSRILGPDNEFYGYLFYASGHPVFKLVDERTLRAHDLVSPVYYGGRERMLERRDPDPKQ